MSNSGNDPHELLDAIQANRPVETPEEAAQQRNLLQRLLATLDPSGPFDEAILEALNELLDADSPGQNDGDLGETDLEGLFRRFIRGQIDTTSLPIGQVGEAAESISANRTGRGFFSTWAGDFAVTVQAAENITEGDPIVIAGQGNRVVADAGADPLTGVAYPARWDLIESDDVDIEAGEVDTILDLEVDRSRAWVETGTVSAQYSEYQYIIDGQPLLDEPITRPLGLFNDRYRFHKPILVRNTLEIRVGRGSGAPGPETYYSNIVFSR